VSSARQATADSAKSPAKSPAAPRKSRKGGVTAVAGEEEPPAEALAAGPADDETAALPPIDADTEPTEGELAEEEEDLELVAEEDNSGPSTDLVRAYLKEIGRVALLNAEQEVELAKRIEAGLFAAEKIRQYECGEAKINKSLLKDYDWLIADGQRAKDHLLEANLRLVVSVAKRYTGRSST
jgi:RNA polymerase primary sigma factor